jgi:hypothetical protein
LRGGEDDWVKRFLAGIVLGLSVVVSGAAPVLASVPPTSTVTIITLANGRNLSECLNSLPKPDCRTSNGADAMQIAVLGVMAGGLVLIGWRVTRAIRQRDDQRTPSGS